MNADGQAGVSERATGSFDVKVAPVTDAGERVAAGRLTLEKTFHGDLEGTSLGEMWTADTAVKGSAGYVAIEKVEGTLRGRRGGFVLLHQGTMRRGGEFVLTIVVVPDSGTDQLAGLTGRFEIVVDGGGHRYTFDYTFRGA
jgi:Protein of unknown function (DUF3224)